MLRTLLLVSDPLDAPIQIADDLNKLEVTLATLAAAEFVVQIAEVDAVSDLLARPHAPFTILHYLGHGTTLPVGDDGALVFEDRYGAARRLDPMQLFLTLNPTGTTGFQLALLSACHSERVAQACLHLGIRHIIAIEGDESVYEIAAVHFYRRFYTVILSGGTVQQAFTAAQRAVALHEDLGAERGRLEAAKFKLLPADGNHAVTLVDLQTLADPDVRPAQSQPLPRLTQPPFHQRPAFFVGRNDDLLAVTRLLRETSAAIVTGVSGVGKSELARELAHRLVARRWVAPEQVYFVALGNSTDAYGVRTSLTVAIGLSAEQLPTQADRADSWLATRLPTNALFILDEAENAIHAGGRAVYNLLETLAQQPNRYLLVTSQNEIGSPHLPAYQLTRLLPAAALQLFAHTAKIAPAEWPLLDLTDLDAVLAMVDRLPRAIELVAKEWRYRHSLDFRSLRADLARLADQIMRDPRYPDEVKSVTVGIQLAYTRLQERSAAAATLFAQLALFPGGLVEQGLAPIFGAAAPQLLPLIEDQSLLERPFADLLYLPAPLQHFGMRQLTPGSAAAQAAIGPAVLRFYFALAQEPHNGWVEQLNELLTRAGAAMGGLIARYEAELPSIEGWLDWGYGAEQGQAAAPRTPQLTALLENLYVVTGELRNQRPRFAQALNVAVAAQDQAGEANVLQALGDLEVREDNLAAARTRYQAALAIYPVIGARLGEANVRQSLGDLCRREGDLAAAWEYFRQALDIHVAIHNQLGIAAVLIYMERAAGSAENYAQSVLLCEEALTIYRNIGDRFGQMLCLEDQGYRLEALTQREAALGAWWQAHQIAQAIGDPTAQRLADIFTQIAAEMGDAAWQTLTTDLVDQAETWRLAGVAAAQQAFGTGE